MIEFGLISLHRTMIVSGGTESSAKNSISRSSIYICKSNQAAHFVSVDLLTPSFNWTRRIVNMAMKTALETPFISNILVDLLRGS